MSDIENLPNVVKLARENAILGNYDDSVKHYQDGLNTIQSFLTIHATKSTKEQWKLVESAIQQELTNVKEIIEINDGFSHNFGTGPKQKPNNGFRNLKNANTNVEIVTPDQNYMMKPPIPVPVQSKQPAFERFGGAEPFAHHKGGPDQYFGKDIDDFGENGNNYFVNNRNPRSYQEEKDPDIWDPPSPPKYDRQKRQPSKWNNNKRKPAASKRVGSQKRPPMPHAPKPREEGKRNYEKPWETGAGGKAGKGKAKKKDTDSFLYH